MAARLCEEATLSDFAERVSITKQELSNIEKGRSAVNLKQAILFARKLVSRPESFFTRNQTSQFPPIL